jgi:predicted phosphoribosyltransferase
MEAPFANREAAGLRLAATLPRLSGRGDVIVLGLPRGGVPVAFALAQALQLPLDVFVVRKLGVPGFEELALGAIASGGVRVLNEDVIAGLPNAEELIDLVTARESLELERRERLYRNGRPPLLLFDRDVVVVDDGVATGSTIRAAVAALRKSGCLRIIVAVPVGPPDTCRQLRREADEVICLLEPEDFCAVGEFYQDFSQVTDEEVGSLLAQWERGK